MAWEGGGELNQWGGGGEITEKIRILKIGATGDKRPTTGTVPVS